MTEGTLCTSRIEANVMADHANRLEAHLVVIGRMGVRTARMT